jgi:hypothetical protein
VNSNGTVDKKFENHWILRLCHRWYSLLINLFISLAFCSFLSQSLDMILIFVLANFIINTGSVC